MTHKITATFRDGTTVTRRTEHEYFYASRKGHGMSVRFHKTYDAARQNVSKYSGEVVRTDYIREGQPPLSRPLIEQDLDGAGQ